MVNVRDAGEHSSSSDLSALHDKHDWTAKPKEKGSEEKRKSLPTS